MLETKKKPKKPAMQHHLIRFEHIILHWQYAHIIMTCSHILDLNLRELTHNLAFRYSLVWKSTGYSLDLTIDRFRALCCFCLVITIGCYLAFRSYSKVIQSGIADIFNPSPWIYAPMKMSLGRMMYWMCQHQKHIHYQLAARLLVSVLFYTTITHK